MLKKFQNKKLFFLFIGLFGMFVLYGIPNIKAAEVPKIIHISGFNIADAHVAIPLLKKAYAIIGYQVDVEFAPAKRSILRVNQGKFDAELIRVHGASTEFSNLLKIPTPILYTKTYVVTKFDSTLSPKVWADLAPLKIGIPLGVRLLKMRTRNMNVYEVNDNASLLRMILNGRIDAGVFPSLMLNKHQEVLPKLRIVEPPIEVTKLYHYIHKKHRDLVDKLNAAFIEIVDTKNL